MGADWSPQRATRAYSVPVAVEMPVKCLVSSQGTVFVIRASCLWDHKGSQVTKQMAGRPQLSRLLHYIGHAGLAETLWYLSFPLAQSPFPVGKQLQAALSQPHWVSSSSGVWSSSPSAFY